MMMLCSTSRETASPAQVASPSLGFQLQTVRAMHSIKAPDQQVSTFEHREFHKALLLNTFVERLKRQIYDAQWSLCGDSSEQQQIDNNGNPAQSSLVSPTLKREKRRNSAVQRTEHAMSSAKRTKTINTYSSIKPSAASIEREQFLATFGEDVIAPGTSPSIRFSNHSGARGSSGLPTGSLQADFVNHEPAMFKESGSTIPDNESSHERMVEQALRSKNLKATSSPGMKLVESEEMQKSSSFPWSASEQTETTKSHSAKDEQTAAPETDLKADVAEPQIRSNGSGGTQQPRNFMPIDENYIIPGPATAVMIAPSAPKVPHQSSPTVHINPVEMQASMPVDSNTLPAEQTQKASKGRKRKVQEESSEPLNSDDLAIGLPKERYKPRPSRRRATSVIEEQIDYSVVPEKAAKSKRSKTAGSRRDSPDAQSQLSGKDLSPEVGRKAKLADDASTMHPTDTKAAESVENEAVNKAPAKTSKSSPVVDVPTKEGTPPSQNKESTPQNDAATAPQSTTTKSQYDDLAFVKPAPRGKLPSKSKRSSTTIFEDHVDFRGKSKSPSLSQQQAIRQSTLADVKSEATPVNRKRGRKAVVPDDDDDDDEEEEVIPAESKRTRKPIIPDDDEDELSFDPNARDQLVDEPPDAPPKKRGRGRPPKTPSKPDTQASAKSAKQKDDENVDEDAKVTLEDPPKKRRGRPPKSAAIIPDANNTADDRLEQQDDKIPAETSIENPANENTPPTKQNTATEMPTPSPEKQQPSVGKGKKVADSDKENKATPKVSPPTHSPIKKSSSPAPYRVGLSKKHRIPSLLRVMRPPPQKRG